MNNKYKVAILSVRSGYIQRGVEKWSEELYNGLPFETKVFSLVETNWTHKVDGIKRDDVEYSKYLRFYNFLERIRSIHPKVRALFTYVTRFKKYNTISFAKEDGEVLSYSQNILQKLEDFKPDIIINHMGGYVGSLLRKYRKKYNIPFITVGGSGIAYEEYANASTMPDAYVAQTPENRMFITQNVRGLRVELIPNGFNELDFCNSIEKLQDEEIKELALNSIDNLEHPYILSTSHLDAHKKIDNLIRAVSKLEQGTLIFTGDGEYKKELLSLAEQLLSGRYAYLGVIDWEFIPKLYRSCDVFCLPSVKEPFGGVIVEALGANLPVVADNDYDRQWMIGGNGVLTNVLDINSLSKSISKCTNTEWGNEPSTYAKKFFSWESVINKYEILIQDVISNYKINYRKYS